MKRLLALFVLVLGIASAQAASADRMMSVGLVSEIADPSPGSTTRIALRMSPRPGWHGYWRNPGQAGRPVMIEWSAPQGVVLGEPSWPAPSRLVVAGLVNYVMPGDYDLVMPMTLPRGMAVGAALPIRATLTWFVCSVGQCSMEKGEASLSLKVGDGSTQGDGADVVRGAQLALPHALYGVRAETSDTRTTLTLPIRTGVDVAKLRLFLVDRAVPVDAAQNARREGAGVVVHLSAPVAMGTPVEGVVSDGVHAWTFSAKPAATTGGSGVAAEASAATVSRPAAGAIPPSAVAPTASSAPPAPAAVSTAAPFERRVRTSSQAAHDRHASSATDGWRTDAPWDAATLVGIVASALLGGLLLNLMPCVFPILSIKALSLLRIGQSEREARVDALAYAFGCVTVCTALGCALVAMRAAGIAAGWSFQLQDPRMVAVLIALSVALALNLAGLFEMRLPVGAHGVGASSFGAGVVSALVATPCSGPFMGAALGTAMMLPAPAAVSVFAALGMGMAAPFLVLGFVPAARRMMPRPGAWMTTFRRILAVPAAFTAFWLAWVLWGQSGATGVAAMAVACVVIALCLWSVGVGQRRGGGRAWTRALPAALAVSSAIALMPVSIGGVAHAEAADGPRVRFDEARLARLRAEGRTVFVDFTARWCLTCKVNENGALASSRTHDAFRKAGVVTMVGDWTDGDPAVTRFLARHGRNSIPFYLVYRPGDARPLVLPQILTASAIEEAVAA